MDRFSSLLVRPQMCLKRVLDVASFGFLPVAAAFFESAGLLVFTPSDSSSVTKIGFSKQKSQLGVIT